MYQVPFLFAVDFHRGLELFGQHASRLKEPGYREALARYGIIVGGCFYNARPTGDRHDESGPPSAENVVWQCRAVPANLTLAMDDSDQSKETPGRCSQHPGELPDKLYELYCEYAEASRAAMLRVAVCPESRRSISEEDPVLGKEEFLARIHAMNDEVRSDFLRRVTSGYEVARLIYRDELLREFRRVA